MHVIERGKAWKFGSEDHLIIFREIFFVLFARSVIQWLPKNLATTTVFVTQRRQVEFSYTTKGNHIPACFLKLFNK